MLKTKGYIMGFHYFFQLSNIVRRSLVSCSDQLVIVLSILAEFKCKDSRNASVICPISQEIKKCSFRADSLVPTPLILPSIFVLLISCSNAWSTPVEKNETKLLLTDKFSSKKKSQVSSSLLCRAYIYDK